MTLNTLRPMTNTNGFSAMADLSMMERSAADRVRMVLTAGADIGAVETVSINPERYRVRSELREYLSTVCDKHFKRIRLPKIVHASISWSTPRWRHIHVSIRKSYFIRSSRYAKPKVSRRW